MIMNRFYFLGFLSIFMLFKVALVQAQAPTIQWQRTIGGNNYDYFYSLQKTTDGGYILGGQSDSNISGDKTENSKGGSDYWVVKLNSTGVIQWQRTIGGSNGDGLLILQQTSDGGYILGGLSSSNISGDKTENSRGGFDYWVVKLNSTGVIQWQKTIGGGGYDAIRSLQQTSDGGYILGGQSNSNISGDKIENSRGDFDFWIVKLNNAGTIQWQKTIGGSGEELLYTLRETSDGSYILGGDSHSGISGEKTERSRGNADFWVLKLSSTGVIQWQKTIGGSNTDSFKSVQQTSDNGYILAGQSFSDISGDKTENSKGSSDFWVLKLNSTGVIQWQKTVGGSSADYLYSILLTSDDGYVLGGSSFSNISGDKTENSKGGSDYWVVKLNNTGIVQWQKTIGGSGNDSFQTLHQTSDDGYILGGESQSDISGDKTEISRGNNDYWAVKLSPEISISPAQCPAASTIKLENIVFDPQPDCRYNVRFTMTGAPPELINNGETIDFNGYEFYTYSTGGGLLNPVTTYATLPSCYDASLKRICYVTLQFPSPPPDCYCNGVTASACYPSSTGFPKLHLGQCTGNEKIAYTVFDVPESVILNVGVTLPYKGAVNIANNKSCGEIYNYQINVPKLSPSSVSITPSTLTVCNGSSTILTANPSVPGSYTYQWYKNGNAIYSINPVTEPTFQVVDAGSYSVLVTKNGCNSPLSAPVTIQQCATTVTSNLTSITTTPSTRCTTDPLSINVKFQTSVGVSSQAGNYRVQGNTIILPITVGTCNICTQVVTDHNLTFNIVPSAVGNYTIQFENTVFANESSFASQKIFTVQQCGVINSCRASDSFELVKLYNATGGANWTNKWNLNTPMTTWYGVTLNATGCVTCIDLDGLNDCNSNSGVNQGNNLIGTLPNLIIPSLVSLFLLGNQLSGTIPNFDLPNLNYLGLGVNQLSGNIPNFNLINLKYLNLAQNKLNGTIPNFNLPNLNYLNLGRNQLNSTIPNFNLPSLNDLLLFENQLSGTIPNFNLPNLKRIDLQTNQLSGTIPNFNLLNLQILSLASNQLSGTIPNFDLPNLRELYLYDNKLNGSIPNFTLSNLTTLLLERNQLSGIVPNFNLPNLKTITLSNNLLIGAVPNPNMPKLERYYFFNNRIDSCSKFTNLPFLKKDAIDDTWGLRSFGNKLTFDDILPNMNFATTATFIYTLQDSIFKDTTFQNTVGSNLTIDLGIDGAITDNSYKWFKNGVLYRTTATNKLPLSNLQQTDAGIYTCQVTNPSAQLLTLYSRKATVLVNQSCRSRDSLALVALYTATGGLNWIRRDNWLTSSSISTWYGIQTDANGCVTSIDLDGNSSFNVSANGNNLTGTIPSLNLPNLQLLHLSGNKFVDTIPNFNMPNLQRLQLQGNQLTGSIPNFNMPNLEILSLFDNQLTGTIPNFNMPNLQGLWLDRNQLIGSIPNFNMPNLQSLSLFSNQLTGSIPNFVMPNLQYLSLFSNQLTGSIPNFNMPNLQNLSLYSNQLTGSIPNFNMPQLEALRLFRNQLDSCPKFTNLSSLKKDTFYSRGLRNYRNKLTFDDILRNMNFDTIATFVYSPQDSIFKDTTFQNTVGSSLIIDLGIDGAITDNSYKWFKNGVLYRTTATNKLPLSNLQQTDAGVYTCEVTNLRAPLLTLYSRKITVTLQCATFIANQIPAITKCGTGAQTFILSDNNLRILNGQTGIVNWYKDANAGQVINSNAYSSTGETVYARISSQSCQSNIIPVVLQVNAQRPSAGTPISPLLSYCQTVVSSSLQLGNLITGATAVGEWQLIPSGGVSVGNNFNAANATLTLSGLAVNTYQFRQIVSSECGRDTAIVSIRIQPAPVAIFSENSTNTLNKNVCQNDVVTLNTTVSNGLAPYTYGWSNNLPNSNLITTPPLSILGISTFSLTVTDSRGCTSNTTLANIGVKPSPIVIVTATPSTICAGATTKLSATVTGGNPPYSNYTWSNNLGSGTSVTTPVLNSGTNFIVTVTDNLGCKNASSAFIAITPPPNVTITARPPSVCENTPTQLTVNVINGTDTYTYAWGLNLSTTNTYTTPPLRSATSYSVTVTDSRKCNSVVSIPIAVNPTPKAKAGVNDTLTCAKQSVNLNGAITANNAASVVAQWQKRSLTGTNIVGNTLSLSNIREKGTYILLVQNVETSCSSRDSLVIEEDKLSPTFTIWRGDSARCNYTTDGKITTSATSGRLPLQYKLNNGAFQDSSIFKNLTGGTYNVTVQGRNGCTDTKTVVVPSPPALNVEINTLKNFDYFVEGNIIPMSSKITNIKGSTRYQWTADPTVKFDCTNCPNPKFPIYKNTLLKLIAYDGNNCFGQDTMSFFLRNVFIPDIITPGNNDGKNDKLMFPALENCLIVGDCAVRYPNSEIIIFNRWGNTVYNAKPYRNEWDGKNQNGEDLPGGTYFYVLRLNLGQGEIIRGNVLIVR
jgi:gliding motility-associated-like protein